MGQVLTVTAPDQFDRSTLAQYVSRVAVEVDGGITSEHIAPDCG